MSEIQEKEIRQIFVIMPFTKTPTRNEVQLTSFYMTNIKDPIEKGIFKYRYLVKRSETAFNITEQIIKDLYNADIVLCDLSGNEGNPNVMYELGIRLALTDKPVILIREEHKNNMPIFDIGGFYTYPYDPLNHIALTQHILKEIQNLEEEKNEYKSPILAIVQDEVPLLQSLSAKRADQLLATMRNSLKMMTWLFLKRFVSFIEGQGVKFPEKITHLMAPLEFIENNRDKFADVDWSGFGISFGAQPALDNYLSNQYLNGLIDPSLEEIFTRFVITYHTYFVSTNYYQGEWHLGNIHRFFGETNIFLRSTKYLRLLLMLKEESEKSELEEIIRSLLKTSHIYYFLETSDAELNTGSIDNTLDDLEETSGTTNPIDDTTI